MTRRKANMSVDEYLRQNWDEYEVDGELRPEARRALELEGGRQYSIAKIEGEKGDYGQGVVLDTNLFDGVSPRNWGKVLGKFVYEHLAGKNVTIYDEEGNAETVHFAREKDRVTKTGANNSHRVIDKLARYKGDNIRTLATVHLSEALRTSTFENSTDDHTHQWMDQNGWEYRKAILQDKKGDIYEATLNIARGRDRNILYDVNNIRKIDTKNGTADGVVPSAQNGRGSLINHGSDKKITQKGGNVKTQFSVAREETDSTGRKILRVHTDAYGNVVLPENMSYRIAGEDSPMSDYGHAMFADDPSSYIAAEVNLLRGSRGIYAVRHDLLTDINDLKKEIARRWDEDRDDAFDNAPMITDEYLEGVTGEEIAEEFDPKDIVDSAAAYDNYELTQWFYDRVIEPGEIAGVKTSDGAVVFDDSAIHRVEVEGNRRKGDPDVQYSVAREEIQAIQNIGRKSVNDFSSEDIEKTEAFARRYYQEMGEKSPFFRAWFGDWRANDSTPVQVANERGDARGVQRNEDTGWDVQVSGKVFNESKAHKMTANRDAWDYLPYINDIVKKAVLLDSYTQGKTKSANSLMMHSLYAVADIGNGPELLKLYVEEMNDPNRRGTAKRAYQLQNIERWQPSAKGSGKSLSPVNSTANIETIADLFAAVKSKDSHFNPQPASKIVDEDGRPLVVYHGKGRPPVRGFPLRNKVLKTPPMRQPKALGGREARGEPSGFLFLSNPIHLHQQNRPKWAVLLE